MDLHTMTIFQTVAKSGSFSAAAQELNYAQSNIPAPGLRGQTIPF